MPENNETPGDAAEKSVVATEYMEAFNALSAADRHRMVQGEWPAQEPRKFVLAGNWIEFRSWCRENGISPHDRKRVVFVNDDNTVRGYEIPSMDDVIVYGTFWDRKDADAIHTHVRCRVRP